MNIARAESKVHKEAQARPSREAGSFTGKKLNVVLCVLLAATSVGLYSPVIGYPFLAWDDGGYVRGNLHVQHGLAWSTIKWAFTSTETAAFWIPLTWLSHALDCQFFALNPAGHHLDNVLIHALNAVLLFLLLAWMTKRVFPSLLVAALFAVHPLNVESVAWVAERKNVLSTLFFFLAIAAYAWYARKPDWRRYLLLAGLFAAGLMAKPMVITLPFVLLLLDYWPFHRTPASAGASSLDGATPIAWSRLVQEKVPLLALSAACAVITMKTQKAALHTFAELPFAVRVENAIVSYALYLWKMVWPARLAALYPYPTTLLPAWQVVLSAVILVGVTVLVLAFRRKRYLPVGWFWFLGTLVPVIGLVQAGEQSMADRFAYVPLIGIFVMTAWGLDDWAEAKKVRTLKRVFPALCVLTALGFATSRQMRTWENDYTLWTHALTVTENNPYANGMLAMALLNPDLAATASRLGGLDTREKRMNEVRRQFQQALELCQKHPDARPQDKAILLNDLGWLDRVQNRMDESRRHYEEALVSYRELAQLNPDVYLPDVASALYNLAFTEGLENRFEEARQHYEEALKIRRQLAEQSPALYLPDLAITLSKLGPVDVVQNRMEDARQHLEEALGIYRQLAKQDPAVHLPNMVMALTDLGNLDRQQNRLNEARQHLEAALEVCRPLAEQNPAAQLPNVAIVLSDLGDLERQENHLNEARLRFQAALRAYRQLAQENSPVPADMVTTLNSLGDLYLHQNQIDEARQCYEELLRVYRELAKEDPAKYLPDVAHTLSYLGFLNRLQKRTEESRACYTEAMDIYRNLSQRDPGQYGGEVGRTAAALSELGRGPSSR
ncbi:MAG: tetratricopeptide repeat protein [Terriglobales bacterium]|jgi:tetratricopeptide (TPR) repeat protein